MSALLPVRRLPASDSASGTPTVGAATGAEGTVCVGAGLIVGEPEIGICSAGKLPGLESTGSELPNGVAGGAVSAGAALTLRSLGGGLAG